MNRFISTRTHAVIGLILGVALILAPNLFGFSDNGGAAVAIPRILGVVIILSELTTDNGIGLKLIPMRAHLALDIVAGLFLAASPWLFGFSDQGTNAWLPHLVAGLAYAGISLATQTEVEPKRSTQRNTHPGDKAHA
ncbi:SPW repeat protein [Candidatus Saccharibacteria bacterium]|nr:SPW repeat protein [Candidatus Saccharibacteria bacterium]